MRYLYYLPKLTWGIPLCVLDVLPKVPNLILANLQQIQSAVSSAWGVYSPAKKFSRNGSPESELLHDGGVYLLPDPVYQLACSGLSLGRVSESDG